MKKSIFKIAGSMMILTLVLNFSGCSNRNAIELEDNYEAMPTVAEENDVNCDTGTGG